MAGLASNVPDWDGIPMLIDMQRFEVGHRVWGHNFVAILLSSLLLAWTQSAFDWIGRIGRWLSARFPQLVVDPQHAAPMISRGKLALVFASVAIIAQLIHLPCDLVVSGGNDLTDWPIRPFWPFSNAAFVFPLIPWGDPGPTVILMGGTIAIAKWRSQTSTTAMVTLIVLCVYLFVRGWLSGRL